MHFGAFNQEQVIALFTFCRSNNKNKTKNFILVLSGKQHQKLVSQGAFIHHTRPKLDHRISRKPDLNHRPLVQDTTALPISPRHGSPSVANLIKPLRAKNKTLEWYLLVNCLHLRLQRRKLQSYWHQFDWLWVVAPYRARHCCYHVEASHSVVECGQIGQFLKIIGYKFSYKSSQNILLLLG